MAIHKGIVRFSERQLQTLRGAFNVAEELTLRFEEPPAGVFDPVRLEQLRDLDEWLERTQESVPKDGTTGDLVMNHTERMVARQALGAVEALLTTAAGRDKLQSFGPGAFRGDIQRISYLLDEIEYATAGELAGDDVRAPIWTSAFEGLMIPHGRMMARVYQRKVESEDGEVTTYWVMDMFDEFRAELGYGCIGDVEAFYRLAEIMAAASHLPAGEREKVQLEAEDAANEALGRLDERDCTSDEDRARLRLASMQAAASLRRGHNVSKMHTLVEMVSWARYRIHTGLATEDDGMYAQYRNSDRER